MYTKWLRYYLDFCQKYHFPQEQQASLSHFLKKLQEKRQTQTQREQVAHAIGLYYELLASIPTLDPSQADSGLTGKNAPLPPSRGESIPVPPGSAILFAGGTPALPGQSTPGPSQKRNSTAVSPSRKQSTPETGKGVSWETEFTTLRHVIQMRQYSKRTLQTYTGWVRKFQAFTRSKSPDSLSPEDVKAFLTYLAVERKVAASTQNQAFNALLFFFRHVLKKEFGKIEGVVRAKRNPYIPVVLSRAEIDAILQHLEPPYDLVVKLLYGCGLRLSECLNLRV